MSWGFLFFRGVVEIGVIIRVPTLQISTSKSAGSH